VGRSKQWNLEPLGLANRAGESAGITVTQSARMEGLTGGVGYCRA
jgi:hypothetical protein